MRKLIGALNFYVRFAPSFTRPALTVRQREWNELPRLDGQTWLVTGASDGIGKAIATIALDLGAEVIGVARNQAALESVAHGHEAARKFEGITHDLSSMSEIHELVSELCDTGRRIDVLVNNVGVLLHEPELTEEQFETSFATNLLGHYALTRWARSNGLLKSGARVVNMSSGGMYNVPLLIEQLNTVEPFDGIMAYALHKRAQAVLNDYWQQTDPERAYYVMHPGWVDTKGVATSLPQFHKLLRKVLRSPREGADTAVWLGAVAPDQSGAGIWFDRKLRDAHIYKMTRSLSSTGAQLDSFLAAKLDALQNLPKEKLRAVAGGR